MKHLIKTVSFLALMSVIPGVMAASPRASVIGKAASRFPSFSGYMNPLRVITTATGTTTASLLGSTDCIDDYTACITADDVCGADLEECTNNVLFHNQMPKCASVLSQCSSAGVQALFGIDNMGALNQKTIGGKYKDEIEYTYPLNTSILGDWIVTSGNRNRYDAAQCVKKYTTCLKRDSVCGEDFELCTTQREFKRQAVACASTLSRCAPAGINVLFGDGSEVWGSLFLGEEDTQLKSGKTTFSEKIKPDSNIDQLIKAGAALAASNAVNTCYKVADQCIFGACGKNPAKCLVGNSTLAGNLIDLIINAGSSTTEDGEVTNLSFDPNQLAELGEQITKRDVTKYLKDMCLETIGANKYCYMTYSINEKADGVGKFLTLDQIEQLMTKKSDTERREIYENVFEDIYVSRTNAATNQRLQDMMDKYTQKAKDRCSNTIKSCAMRVCGGGIGALCWNQVYGNNRVNNGHIVYDDNTGINVGDTYNEIKIGCQAVVNSDINCAYSATIMKNDDGAWVMNDTEDAFSYLFPNKDDGGNKDPIGVITSLNGALATSYDKYSISNMEKQCKNTAKSCVESMCGADFQYCYRTRTDIVLSKDAPGAYNSGSNKLDKSMNTQTGVLDYNIAIGLCMDTVENSKVCEEHLRITAAQNQQLNKDGLSWGGANSVADAWGSGAKSNRCTIDVDKYSKQCDKDNPNTLACVCRNKNPYLYKTCFMADDEGCMYDKALDASLGDADEGQILYKAAADTVLRSALAEIELKAQAQYKARLQNEQNMCYANNQGGGTNETFRWAKMNKKTVNTGTNYEMTGLIWDTDVKHSDDLIGSFCAAKVSLVINDTKIKKFLEEKKNNTNYANISSRYFPVGDSFVCGSWIPESLLEEITKEVSDEKKTWGAREKGIVALSTILGTGVGGFGGGLLGEYLATGKVFGSSDDDAIAKGDKDTYSGRCISKAQKCSGSSWSVMRSYCRDAVSAANRIGVDTTDVRAKINKAETAYIEYTNAKTEEQSEKKKASETAAADVAVAIQGVFDECQAYADNKQTYDGKNKKRDTGVGVGTSLGAIAGGLLGAGISVTAIKAKQRKAGDKAAQEWLDAIGQHIQCYVGTQYVGSYGDVIGLQLSDD